MPTERKWPGGGLRRAVVEGAAEAGIVLPWPLFSWLNYAIACHRWAGWKFALSLVISGTASAAGWHLARRAAARYDDARLGDLLEQVKYAPPWALFPHPVQIIKREHAARCQRRWGVTACTSGWELFRRSWRAEGVRVFCCLVGGLHAWWLGV